MPIKHSTYSVIIVGSGIAGLYAAIKMSETLKLPDGILVMTKSQLSESNSRYAQGGIVGVMPENKADSVSLHVADTIKAGCGLCDFNVVKFISENSGHAIKDLMKYGVKFDRNKKNELNYTLEGAHSVRRILHVGGDATGYGIEKELVNKVKNDPVISSNITIYEETLAADLLVDSKNVCRGVIAYNEVSHEYEAVYAPITVLATGGTGQVYKYTTNPSVTTGDGLALAIRAGAKIKDMEFIQFHPTPRDVVARAIYSQLSDGNDVFLDATGINIDKFKTRFPNIYKTCTDNGIDVSKDYIPVSPAAHYCMGGIKTEVNGKTSIENLYAIGEAGCTSLHGANRLASNSLLECVVTAYELVNTLAKMQLLPSKIIDEKIMNTIKQYTNDDESAEEYVDIEELTAELKKVMWDKVGIIRTEESLNKALRVVDEIENEFKNNCPDRSKFNSIQEYELRNMLYVAKCIINSALNRKESIGAHYRADSVKDDSTCSNSISQFEEVSDDTKITA